MPYYRRSRWRGRRLRRSFKSRSKGRAAYGTSGLRRRSLMRTGGFGAGMLELKFVDSALVLEGDQAYDSTAPTIPFCNGVGPGTDYNLRLGRRTCNEAMMLTYTIRTNSASAITTDPDYVRVIVVYDLQPNGATIAFSDILAGATTQMANCLAFNNLNNKARFLILYDKLHAVSTGMGPVHVRKYIKLGGLETTYSGATNGIASCSTGAIHVMCCGGMQNTVSSDGAILSMKTRVRFRDCS